MASTIIQIKRSGTQINPTALKVGELAYSYVDSSSTLFIGVEDPDSDGYAARIAKIGGEFYTNLLTVDPGVTTSNKFLLIGDSRDIDYLKISELIADGITVLDLNADLATIEIIHASSINANYISSDSAYIQLLNVDNGFITNLEADSANIANLSIDNVDINSLTADSAIIGDLQATSAAITMLEADSAHITTTNIGSAYITDLEATNAIITIAAIDSATITDLEATNAIITIAAIDSATITDLEANNAHIATVNIDSAHITDLEATNAIITISTIDSAAITDLEATNAHIATANIDSAYITDLEATNAHIATANIDSAYITSLEADSGTITTLNSTTGYIDNLTSNIANIQTLNAESGYITNLEADSAHIINATIDDLTAGQLYTGRINGPQTIIIDPSDRDSISGTVVIWGDLHVEGVTTVINSTTVTVNDKNIVLADSAPNAAAADGAGITINGANSTILYNSLTDFMDFNKGVSAPTVTTTVANISDAQIDSATVNNLEADSAYIATLNVDDGNIVSLAAGDIVTTTLTVDSAYIDTARIDQLATINADIDSAHINNLSTNDFIADNITVQNLDADSAHINNLSTNDFIADSATIDGLSVTTNFFSTAPYVEFKSDVSLGANDDNIINVVSIDDSTIFEVRKDGSINLTGEIYKDGLPFTSAGIFKTNLQGYKYYDSQGGRVGLFTETPIYPFQVNEGPVSFSGSLNPFSTDVDPQVDSGSKSRFIFIPQKAVTRSGWFQSSIWDGALFGEYSTALGKNVEAAGTASFAVGDSSMAGADYSIAMGLRNRISSNSTNTIAIGIDNRDSSSTVGGLVIAQNSILIGKENKTDRTNTTLIGQENSISVAGGVSTGNISILGYQNSVKAASSTVIGVNNQVAAGGSTSYTIGSGNAISGANEIAIGFTNTLSGSNAVAIGSNNTISGQSSYAFGAGLNVSGNFSVGISLTGGTKYAVSTNNTLSIQGGRTVFGVDSGNSVTYTNAYGDFDVYVNAYLGDGLYADNGVFETLDIKNGGTLNVTDITYSGSLTRSVGGFELSANTFEDYGDYIAYDGGKNVGVNALDPWDTFTVGGSIGAYGTTGSIYLPGDSAVLDSNQPENKFLFSPVAGLIRAGAIPYDSNSNLGLFSVAMGFRPVASANYSIALGDRANASGVNSIAIGSQSTASGQYSVSLGRQNYNDDNHANTFLIGNVNQFKNSATSSGVFAFGLNNDILNTSGVTNSYIIGYNNEIQGTDNYILGKSNSVSGSNTYVLGANVTTGGFNLAVINPSANSYSVSDSNAIIIPDPATRLAIGKTSTTYTLDVNGDVNIDGDLFFSGLTLDSRVASGGLLNTLIDYFDSDYVLARATLQEFWQKDSNALYYNPSAPAGGPLPIGIRTSTPDSIYSLDVFGDINASGYYINDIDLPTYIKSNVVNTTYLSTIVDAAYINSRVVISGATIAQFVDSSYVQGIIDSAYILARANDSSEWQRSGNTLFFGTYPNVSNVNVVIGADSSIAKFRVAGDVQIDSAINIDGVLTVTDSAQFTSNLTVNNLIISGNIFGAEDSLGINSVVGDSSRTTFYKDVYIDSGATLYYGAGSLSLDDNILRIVDSDYIGARTLSPWRASNNYEIVYNNLGSRIVIGRTYIDSSIAFYVDSGTIVFNQDSFDTNPNALKSNVISSSGAGARMAFVPQRAAFRAGAVTGTQWDEANIGLATVAIGYDASTKGHYSVAIGKDAIAGNSGVRQGIVSIGYGSVATDNYSVAIGKDATAVNGVAIGQNTISALNGVAIGRSNQTSTGGTAIGITSVTGLNGVAVGTSSTASTSAVSMGILSKTGTGSVALGIAVTATSTNGVGIGKSLSVSAGETSVGVNNSSNYASLVVGAYLSGNNRSVIVGRSNNNNYKYNTIFGQNNSSNSYSSTIIGVSNTSNRSSLVVGNSNTNNRELNIFGIGNNNSTDGRGGSIYGNNSTVYRGGMAYGDTNTITNGGYIFGVSNTIDQGGYSYGASNTVTRTGYAFGQGNTVGIASGTNNPGYAFGQGNTVYNGGTAVGRNNTAYDNGLAFGVGVDAHGANSLAFGNSITVSGNYSVGFGLIPGLSDSISDDNIFAIIGGTVGIDTTTPDANYKIEISGNINVDSTGDYYRHDKLLSDWIIDDVTPDAITSTVDAEYIRFNADSAYIQSAANSTYVKDIIDSAYAVALISPDRYFGTDTLNTFYTGVGNIGIKTSDPQYDLEVNGDINLTGQLYSNGVLVVPSTDSLGDFTVTYINQTFYIDSATLVTDLIDSAYVRDHFNYRFYIDSTYVSDRIDYNFITDLIDSDYVVSRFDYNLYIDAAYVNNLVDFTSVPDSAWTLGEIADATDIKAFNIVGRSTNDLSIPAINEYAVYTNTAGNTRVGIGKIPTISSSQKGLDVAGIIKNDGDLFVGGDIYVGGFKLDANTSFINNGSYLVYDPVVLGGPRLNVGIHKSAPLYELDVAGYINADSGILINGADLLNDILDSDYVQSRANEDYLKSFIDSSYIQSAIDLTYLTPLVTDVADETYIKSIADSAYVKSAANSAWITSIANETYIKSIADSAWITSIADSAYVKGIADSAWIISVANEAYITSIADSAYVKGIADGAYIKSVADSAYVQSAIDTDYFGGIVDSAYVFGRTGIGKNDIDFGQYKISYANAYTSVVAMPNPGLYTGMFGVTTDDNWPKVAVNGNWKDVALGNQSVGTSDDVTFNMITTTDGLIVGGNLQVNGTTSTVNSLSLEVTDNMIYMNAGESSGSPTAFIDVGFAANYNDDGSYHHTGFFRDATDGIWKVFENYDPEPDASTQINTGHASFRLAKFQASSIAGKYLGFDSDIGSITTSNVAEGSNLYYTTARVDSDVLLFVDSAYVNARVGSVSSIDASNIVTDTIIVNQLTNKSGTTISHSDSGVDVSTFDPTIIDTITHNSAFLSAEYLIHAQDNDNNHTQISKILLTYNTVNVNSTEYGIINTYENDSNMGSYDISESSGDIVIKFTKEAGTGNIIVKPVKTIIK